MPTLRPGDIVVMDNLSAHKNETTLELIRQAKAGGSGGWSGHIDDLRIYSSELDSAQIQALAQ